jgi:SAM-dependent methyltransferase
MRMLRPLCRERVVGIDMSVGMLGVCRQKTASAPGDAALEYVRGDALDMPFHEEFDAAVCFGACGHILRKDEPRFIEQVRQVLKPGGRFFFVSSYLPPKWSRAYWYSRSFNAAMHIRNLLIRPPFIMYYLTFILPAAQRLLEENGFLVEVKDDLFAPEAKRLKLVIATKK